MPNKEADYSKTVIYKICCKDESIKDIYVGHTTNFFYRKIQHKTCCNNKFNNCKIYNFINENGGWNNWEMIELETVNCKDLSEARQKENEYYNLLNPTLNTIKPYVPYVTPPKYCCEHCNYKCLRLSEWNRHIITQKHIKITQTDKNITTYNCSCGNTYKHKQSLHKHKKICKIVEENNKQELSLIEKEKLTLSDAKMMLNLFKEFVIEQNQDFQQQILEIIKKVE